MSRQYLKKLKLFTRITPYAWSLCLIVVFIIELVSNKKTPCFSDIAVPLFLVYMLWLSAKCFNSCKRYYHLIYVILICILARLFDYNAIVNCILITLLIVSMLQGMIRFFSNKNKQTKSIATTDNKR